MEGPVTLSEQIRLDENGRVTLDDAALEALMASFDTSTAGSGGTVNSNCTNSSSCENSMNTTSCTNGACAGSLNVAGQCREVSDNN